MEGANFQITLFFIFILIILIPGIFYLITLQNALKAVEPGNRTMQPGNVWLVLIPFFNLVWMFIVVNAVGTSFKNQYEQYGIFKSDKPTYSIGLATCILQLCSFIPLVPLAAIVCWIIHWVKVNEHKNELLRLKQANEYNSQPSIFD